MVSRRVSGAGMIGGVRSTAPVGLVGFVSGDTVTVLSRFVCSGGRPPSIRLSRSSVSSGASAFRVAAPVRRVFSIVFEPVRFVPGIVPFVPRGVTGNIGCVGRSVGTPESTVVATLNGGLPVRAPLIPNSSAGTVITPVGGTVPKGGVFGPFGWLSGPPATTGGVGVGVGPVPPPPPEPPLWPP